MSAQDQNPWESPGSSPGNLLPISGDRVVIRTSWLESWLVCFAATFIWSLFDQGMRGSPWIAVVVEILPATAAVPLFFILSAGVLAVPLTGLGLTLLLPFFSHPQRFPLTWFQRGQPRWVGAVVVASVACGILVWFSSLAD